MPKSGCLREPEVRYGRFSTEARSRAGRDLEVRLEAFNFPNHPNWNSGATDVRTLATFGVINTARTMREMQFGFKYIF